MIGFSPLATSPLAALQAGPITTIDGALAVTLATLSGTRAGAVALKGDLSKTLGNVVIQTFDGEATVRISAVVTITLDDASDVAASTIARSAAASITLGNVTLGFTATTLHQVVTSTVHYLNLPVDYVLAGAQPIIERGREWDIPPARRTEKGSIMRSRVAMIGGKKSTFTTSSSRRGYD